MRIPENRFNGLPESAPIARTAGRFETVKTVAQFQMGAEPQAEAWGE